MISVLTLSAAWGETEWLTIIFITARDFVRTLHIGLHVLACFRRLVKVVDGNSLNFTLVNVSREEYYNMTT